MKSRPFVGLTLLILGVILGISIQGFRASVATPLENAMHVMPSEKMTTLMSAMPSLTGDRTKRYTVGFNNPKNVTPNVDTMLSFQVNDASNGNPTVMYQRVYTKLMHLVIVDEELEYFTHIHPEQTENTFTIATKFPHAGRYHLYLNFQPFGSIEQQFAFTLDVGNTKEANANTADQSKKKTFGAVTVELSTPELVAQKMEQGEQTFTFTLSDATKNTPITTLKPYLDSFGHLVMINTDTYEYLHVHPTNAVVPKPGDMSGPTVEFLPMSIHDPIRRGTYRLFAQFNPNGKLIVTNFTVVVK